MSAAVVATLAGCSPDRSAPPAAAVSTAPTAPAVPSAPASAVTPPASPSRAASPPAGTVPADQALALRFADAGASRAALELVSTRTGRATRTLRWNVLVDDTGFRVAADLSPDRRAVYYSSDYLDGGSGKVNCGAGVYRLTVATGVVHRIDAASTLPRVSPDGRRLAMVSGCTVDRLTLLDLATGERRSVPFGRALRHPDGSYDGIGIDLDWLADGRLAVGAYYASMREHHDRGVRILDPTTDRTLDDAALVPGSHRRPFLFRAYGAGLLGHDRSGLFRVEPRTGARTAFVTDRVDAFAVGPDGTVAFQRGRGSDPHVWFADRRGRTRRGPALAAWTGLMDW